MSARLATVVTLAVLLATPAAAATRRADPTRAQIRAAIKRAERSPDLWATVNICDTPKHPYSIGIRGQMPTLGFAARLSMRIQVKYWSVAKAAFESVPGAVKSISLGVVSSGLYQGGARFPFGPGAGLLAATVRFEWKLAGRVLGRTTGWTSAHHPDAAYADPKHYSASDCLIK